MGKIVTSINSANTTTTTVTTAGTKLIQVPVNVFKDVLSTDPAVVIRNAHGNKEISLDLGQNPLVASFAQGLVIDSHSGGGTPALTAGIWAAPVMTHFDGTMSSAVLPEILPNQDGYVCLLSVGSSYVTVDPPAGQYLDEATASITYTPYTLVMFISFFGDTWVPYVLSSRVTRTIAGSLIHGVNRRTSGAAFALPLLIGDPFKVEAVVFVNLTGVDVTVSATGGATIETGVAAPSYVVPAAQRITTFLDDGSIWEPSVPAA